MKLEKLAALAEIVSSIAILLTLIFLALQMQQNTRAIQANSRQNALMAEMDYLNNALDNPGLILNRAKSDLTDEDKLLISLHLSKYLRQREHDWLQLKNGVMDQSAWNSYFLPLRLVLSSPVTRQWWEGGGSENFLPSFTEEINKYLEDYPVNNTIPYLSWFND